MITAIDLSIFQGEIQGDILLPAFEEGLSWWI